MKKIRLGDVVQRTITGEWGTEKKNDKNDIYVIRTADFNNDGTINYENILKRNISNDKINEKKLEIGDIIIEKSGGTDKNPVGRVVLFENNNIKSLANNFTQVLRIKQEHYYKYVFYQLLYKYKRGATMQMFNKTTGIQNLQMKMYINQMINICSKKEQIRIANKLDKIKEIIDLRKEQIKELDKLIKYQFVDMFDLYNYEERKLSEISNFIDYRGHTPRVSKIGVIRMINAKSVGKGFFKYIDEYVTEDLYDEWMHRGFAYPGDVLFVTEGHTFGNTCLIPNDLTKFALGQRIITIQGNKELNNVYLCYYMQLDEFRNKINMYKTGGTAQGIRSKDLSKITIPVPPIELQNKFAKFVKKIDKQKYIINKSLKETKELQESLMNKYFGE